MKTITLIVTIISLCSIAHADDMVLRAGTKIVTEDNKIVHLDKSHILLTRETSDKLYAKISVNDDLRNQLDQCQKDGSTLRKEEDSSFWTALKWGGIGGAVVTAFVLGLMVGH